ncbi:BQ5605_C024g09923 [Microbotryum silenes-dioicae]|uniref:BQ5605_C024g09923 protein n=1 Tax=Microbotryum silenes-dioicae TaxID=796604 RepID=A0A2X0MQR1_9BASI|nr:BQ5605_C024g09923 [Microbotryum silenes-dioicae]
MARPSVAGGALLDPAFDDDEHPLRHEHQLQGDAYGEHDPDQSFDELDVDGFGGHFSHHDALGDQLGPGFGSMLDTLGDGDDGLLVERFDDDDRDRSYVEDDDDELERISTTTPGDPAASPSRRSRSMNHHRTPSRSHANGIVQDDGHLSLAFELASAQSPARAPHDRDLMRQLGFDEEDQVGDDHEPNEDAQSHDRSFDDQDEHHGALQAEVEDVLPRSTSNSPEHPSSPSRQSTLGRRSIISRSNNHMSRASIASFATMLDAQPDPVDLEAVLAEASEQVNESNLIVTSFLNHLKRHTTNEVTPEHEDDKEDFWIDRQPVIEVLANTLLRSLHERTKTCQSQWRELAEIERALAKNDVGWQATLGRLDDILWTSDEEEEEEDEGQEEGDCSEERKQDGALTSIPPTIPGSEPNDPTPLPPPHRAKHRPPQISPTTTAVEELTTLRNVTASLTDSLSSVHEMTQVNHAAAGDTSRKLRALRAQATTLRDELNAWERAEEFVAHREEEKTNGGSLSWRENIASLAREEMREAETLLNEAWDKATSMLCVR